MTQRLRIIGLFALGTALSLAACSGKPDAPKPPLNEGAAANESENATAEAPPPPVDTPPVSQKQAESEPVASDLAPDGSSPQVRDDADASGMTARLPEPDASQPATGAEAK